MLRVGPRVYKVGTEFAKSKRYYDNPLVRGSLLCIHGTPEAKKRKDAFNPFFSKAAVRRVEFLCHDKLAQFLNVLKKAGENSTIVDMSRAFRCLTADVIMHYSYQRDFGALSSKDFRCDVIDAFDDLAITAKVGTYFKRTFAAMDWLASLLPKSLLARALPPMVTVVEFQEVHPMSNPAEKEQDCLTTSALRIVAPTFSILSVIPGTQTQVHPPFSISSSNPMKRRTARFLPMMI
jgi:hypothetical protein